MEIVPARESLLIPLVAILMPLFLVPTIMILKFRHKRREWEHHERMRALASQLPHGRVALGGGNFGGVAAIGGGVPVAAVFAAFLTSILWGPDHHHEGVLSVPVLAWACALLISAGALVISFLIASMHVGLKSFGTDAFHAPPDFSKPAFDPDGLDVVPGRGSCDADRDVEAVAPGMNCGGRF